MKNTYTKKLRLSRRKEPAVYGLVFGLLFGGLMTVAGLSLLFAASASIRFSPLSQNANPGQSKVTTVVLNAGTDIVNGGYVQFGFDSGKLDFAGLEPLNGNEFTITQQQMSGSAGVFRFVSNNPSGIIGEWNIANLRFTTKSVSGSETTNISGAGVPYQGSESSPQYYQAAALASSITISPASQPPPATPAPSTPSPGTQPGPGSNPPPTHTGSGNPGAQPSATPDSNTQDPVSGGVFEQPEQTGFSDEYANIPGLFGSSVFGRQEAKEPQSGSVLLIIVGLTMSGAAAWFYLINPRLVAHKEHRSVIRTPSDDKASSIHDPSEIHPSGKTEDPKPVHAATSISHHTKHAFPGKSKPASPQKEQPETKAASKHAAAPVKAVEPPPEPKPKQEPPAKQVPKTPEPKPSATIPSPKPAPQAASTDAEQTAKKPWEDIRKEQADRIAHAHKNLGDDENLPDMFELAEQHPESFGRQTQYDEGAGHAEEPSKPNET